MRARDLPFTPPEGAPRECKGPTCPAHIPSEAETREAIRKLPGAIDPVRALATLSNHAFGVCSDACWDAWVEFTERAKRKRWRRAGGTPLPPPVPPEE